MPNPLLPMAQSTRRGNDASTSVLGAVHQMKSVGRQACSRVVGRRGSPPRQSGFSLLELIVVVAIIGILMAISLPAYKEYIIRANMAAAKAVLMEVASRQEQFVMKSGAYSEIYATNGCVFSELAYTVPAEVCANFDLALTAGNNAASTVVALQGLPIFRVSASGKVGTIQEGFPVAGATTEYSINQFGLKLPVSAW